MVGNLRVTVRPLFSGSACQSEFVMKELLFEVAVSVGLLAVTVVAAVESPFLEIWFGL
ncbi:hypothetical protein G7077_08920 [Sphingomonas piscis]|uniref:Uncharacterized protein n=1 Tax=Sphingomonas piscis TaxID=2714943 RepID=A0A6G7YQI1_9SPHN|nr:hypothetical protein [Sphingomonas piscis]QIK79000.1 hypothetical protein G7077_08920 [Sphingomonas piscis]